MLNFKVQLEKLTLEQKIALLVDDHSVSEDVARLFASTHVGVANLWDFNNDGAGKLFPSAESLANSFDADLFYAVADKLATRGEAAGKNLFILPSCKAPLDIYERGLSEDPLLIGRLMRGSVRALHDRRYGVAMQAPLLDDKELVSLHGEAELRTLYDRIVRPYRDALQKQPCQAVVFSERTLDEGYAEADAELMREIVPRGAEELSFDRENDHIVQSLVEGKIVFGANDEVIKTALENYHNMKRFVEEGGSTIEELQSALADGSAISEELIDEALDRRLTLAASCAAMAGRSRPVTEVSQRDVRSVALDAARNSIVLVKNEKKTLPLSHGKKLALVGDIIMDGPETEFRDFLNHFASLEKKKKVVGFARGYELNGDRSEHLIPEAVTLAKHADVTILFMGMGTRRADKVKDLRSWTLPANQLALFDALTKTGKPVVVVIAGSRLPEMNFDRRAKAVLLMPAQGMMVPQAISEVLHGEYNPTARLAFAGYDDPDAEYRELQKYVTAGIKKTGPFIGYRRSLSEDFFVKYPFGFGLSYGTVTYSKIKVKDHVARIKLKNRSKYAYTETVQIYVGVPSSSVLRPKSELKGLLRVHLKPHQSMNVIVPLEWLGVYDKFSHELMLEAGTYQIAVARAAGENHLLTTAKIMGQQIPQEDFHLSEYLHAVSDIRKNQYTTEGYCKPMKTKGFFKNTGMTIILTTLFADVVYLTCALLSLFDLYQTLIFAGIISGGLYGIGALCLFIHIIAWIVSAVSQSRKEREATETLFRTAETADVETFEELFIEEFDIPEQQVVEERVEEYTETEENRFAYMTIDVDLPTLTQEMKRHFTENGIELTLEQARTVLSAVMTSRFLVFRSPVRNMTERFTALLGSFFGTGAVCTSFAGCSLEDSTLLHAKATNGSVYPTAVIAAMQEAATRRELPHFVNIMGLPFAKAGALLTPYIRYFSHPKDECKIKENGENYVVPSNMWFVMSAADGDSIENFEPFIANFAAVVDLTSVFCAETAEKTKHELVGCTTMEALIYRARKKSEVDEDLWKSVDRMESYVNDRTPYHIGNKLSLQMECYLAVYAACGGDSKDAMDSVIATKLLPGVLARLRGNEVDEEGVDLVQSMSTIFGEEHIKLCRYMIKHMAISFEANANEQPAEVSAEAVTETPAEAVTDAPAEAVAETPAETVEEASAETVEETPAEEVEETPVEAAEETPAESVEEAPAETAEETPAEVTEEAPVETAEEVPAEVVADPPVETTEEVTAETVTEAPAETVTETSAEAEVKPAKKPRKTTRKKKEEPVTEAEPAPEAVNEAEENTPAEQVQNNIEEQASDADEVRDND